ncbi:hypothetical protein MJ391_25515 [Escherichia coli]|nr:hypothetical protein MJ391_25515 [Escherichia coli]
MIFASHGALLRIVNVAYVDFTPLRFNQGAICRRSVAKQYSGYSIADFPASDNIGVRNAMCCGGKSSLHHRHFIRSAFLEQGQPLGTIHRRHIEFNAGLVPATAGAFYCLPPKDSTIERQLMTKQPAAIEMIIRTSLIRLIQSC